MPCRDRGAAGRDRHVEIISDTMAAQILRGRITYHDLIHFFLAVYQISDSTLVVENWFDFRWNNNIYKKLLNQS